VKTTLSIACGVIGLVLLGYGLLIDTAIGVCDADCPAKGNHVWPWLVAGASLWVAAAVLWGLRRR
jgi:hypothetical protein